MFDRPKPTVGCSAKARTRRRRRRRRRGLLFFSLVFVQFHTLFIVIHKLPDSITDEGFGLFLATY